MKKYIVIPNGNINIPAVLWGEPTDRLLITVHGDMSHKEDTVIGLAAEHAVAKGYYVLSFDLPEHGERQKNDYLCDPVNCISDLQAVYSYAKTVRPLITLFACSIGAYFSLQAFHEYTIRKSLFLSPAVNMQRVIENMMSGFNITREKLKAESQIELPIGKTLNWDYYTFVTEHPLVFKWNSPISILYGEKDMLVERKDIEAFSLRYNAELTILKDAEHYFHTNMQLNSFEDWINYNLD